MKTMTVSKFKATCLEVLGNIEKTGDQLVITKRGEPIALVSPPPIEKKKKNWVGICKDEIEILGDVVSPALSVKEWEVLK